MGVLETERLHFLGRSVFLATGVVYDEEHGSSGIAAFQLCFPNPGYNGCHSSALHTIHAPWRMIQEIGDTAEMTIVFRGVLNLRHIFTSGTENDAVNEGEQMAKLGFRKSQLQRQNELDDR
jgi:hypothetical protein